MIGVILALVSAVFFGLAVAIQKYSLSSLDTFSIKQMAMNKKWILSMVIGIIGLVLYAFALSMEALSTVQPVASAYLLIPILAGVFIFKEKLGVKKWFLIAVFLVGIGLVSFY